MLPFAWPRGSTVDDAVVCDPAVAAASGLDGTLFRLPLRTPEQAARSLIAGRHFALAELQSLLMQFTRASADMLLFLRHVEEISVHVRPADGGATRRLGRIALRGADAALRLARRCSVVPSASATAPEPEPEAGAVARRGFRPPEEAAGEDTVGAGGTAYTLCVETRWVQEGAGEAEGTQHWLLQWDDVLGEAARARMGLRDAGGEHANMAAIAGSLGAAGWVGAAMRLDLTPSATTAGTELGAAATRGDAGAGMAAAAERPTGKVYCFLPLPIRSGLAVHVHASFALSSNRRSLWGRSDDGGGGQSSLKGE